MLGHPPQLQGQSSGGTGEDGEPIESDGLGARAVDLAQETGLEEASPPSSPVL
jgi:hypothetical protein